MYKVSNLYYEQGLNQEEIKVKLHISRSKVSRLLNQARQIGVVQITVHPPHGFNHALEQELETRFSLKEAIVVEVNDPASSDIISRELGIAAAGYFSRICIPGQTIGISWGTTLNQMVLALQQNRVPNTHLVQLIGGLGKPESEVHATDLCHRLARQLNSRLTLLPAPGIVENHRTKEILLSDGYVRKALDLFSEIDLAYVGIGAPTLDSVVMRDGSILTERDRDILLAKGAVGDIALRFFDSQGKPIISDVDERVIGITLEQLSKIKQVIGVGGGLQKEAAIRGALQGNYIHVLITDHITAQLLTEKEIQASNGRENGRAT
jgi:DNA-binding transcriptional regulator LsrR (DeoR family)